MKNRDRTQIIFLVCAIVIFLVNYNEKTLASTDDNTKYIVNPIDYGAKGDGLTDDSLAFQKALTVCSEYGLICKIGSKRNFLISRPLYLWGKASLLGEEQSSIIFNVKSSEYLVNIGIKGPRSLAEPFSGTIDQVAFKIVGGEGGRILYFWRTDGAKITNNNFEVGNFKYSATSSGNDNKLVENGFVNCIRKNITIKGNVIIAEADEYGSEGIGLGHFDGALIEDNIVKGVGDDPIGIHFCKNIKILRNNLASVDGRLFVVNSKMVEIAYNFHERIRSKKNNLFYKGISLLYIGFETFSDNEFAAPTDILVYKNRLYYPEKAYDSGAAIYLYGPRNVIVEENEIINDSSIVTARALHLLPARFFGNWNDPDEIDLNNVARVYNAQIIKNSSIGTYPLAIGMSGNCNEYRGKVIVQRNIAKDFSFYCENVINTENNRVTLNLLKKNKVVE